MRKDVGVDGDAQRLAQLVWLLFLQIFDAQEAQIEATDATYRSPIPKRLRWRNWAGNSHGPDGDELLKLVNDDLFPTLKNLKGTTPRHCLVRAAFSDAHNYMRSGVLLRQVIEKLNNELVFDRVDNRHPLGDVYEQILRDLQNAGNAGEYYTPRALTDFIVERLDPRLGEVIMDPACGTGGFLTSALEHIRRQEVKTLDDERRLEQAIHGIEKKPLPHLLCVTNMLLHGVQVPLNIQRANMLSSFSESGAVSASVDVVVTNPPFGGFEETGFESKLPSEFRTKRTADLFLFLIPEILRRGGRGAMVVPDGLLFGEGVKLRIRRRFLETCNLHTVLRLPAGVFAPYTDIKTNVLFFVKGEATREVWYYEHTCPPGLERYWKTMSMKPEDLAAARAWWNSRNESPSAWRVSIGEIVKRNYDLDSKNPHVQQRAQCDPAALLADYQRARAAADEARGKLFRELENLLADKS